MNAIQYADFMFLHIGFLLKGFSTLFFFGIKVKKIHFSVINWKLFDNRRAMIRKFPFLRN